MASIVTLNNNMINMIAAGEVIERPANVVKEMLENSIDSGAGCIRVDVGDGGKKLIRVTDDGGGMSGEDLELAFESHSTSKVKNARDLESISTLGFRGEALASIASIAQVKAVSRVRDSAQANCIEIDCGQKSALRPCSGDYGTQVEVRDIFYKLPGRRKFLKTANTEMNHIVSHFTRVGLAHNELELTLTHNGRESCRLEADEGIRRRIGKLFSSDVAENLIETSFSEKNTEIRALMGTADISRTSSKFQYVFLNGRFIRDKFISHAIKEAYRGSLGPDRWPIVFIFMKMPYDQYDVNVHPTKTEVRFYNANLVHSQVLACLREKLLSTNLDAGASMPAAARPSGRSPGYGAATSQRDSNITQAIDEFFKRYRAGSSQRQFGFEASGDKTKLPESDKQTGSPELQQRREGIGRRKYLQVHDSYIVAQTEEGFVVVDQHALHERVLYEKLRQRIATEALESQKLLIPETFELSAEQQQAMEDNSDLISRLGIELSPFGPGIISIQAFPSLLSKASYVDFVRDLLDMLAEKTGSVEADSLLDEVLNMAACKAAIKVGQKLSEAEIDELLDSREQLEHPSRCPHGRPTTIKFSVSELEKQFGRT